MRAGRKSNLRWAILTQLYLCMLSYAVVFQSIPPVMSLVIDDFHLSHHQAGLLMSMFALPGVIVSLPAGMLADRYGVKPVGILSMVLTIVGTLLVSTGNSFEVLLAGRIIAGTGASSLVIIIPQAIAQWFFDRDMGVAMGIFNTAMPIGTIVSLNAFPLLAGAWGWRAGLWTTVFFTAVALVILAFFYRRPAGSPASKGATRASGNGPGTHGVGVEIEGKAPPEEESQNHRRLRLREQARMEGATIAPSIVAAGFPIWLVGGAWAFFNASIISLFTFAPDYIVGQGLTLGSAGFATSLVMIGSMVLSPVIGFTVDRVGRKEVFIAAGGLGMALFLILLPGIRQNFGLLLLCVGFAAALIPAPVFSLAASVVSHERLGMGYGILSMLNNVGIFLGPQLVGLSRDTTGSYQASFWLMALFALLATATILSLWIGRRRKTEPTP